MNPAWKQHIIDIAPAVLFGIAGIILIQAIAPEDSPTSHRIVLGVGVAIFALICHVVYLLYRKAQPVLGTTLALVATAASIAIVGTGLSLASPFCPGSQVSGRCTPPEAAQLGTALAGSFGLVVMVVFLSRLSYSLIKATVGKPLVHFWKWNFGSKVADDDTDEPESETIEKLDAEIDGEKESEHKSSATDVKKKAKPKKRPRSKRKRRQLG